MGEAIIYKMSSEKNIYKIKLESETDTDYIFKLPRELTRLAISQDKKYILLRFLDDTKALS